MPAAILAGCRRILLHRFRKGVVMLGIGLILALLAVSFIGHNMSMVYSCLILLALRFLLPHSALEYVAGHGSTGE